MASDSVSILNELSQPPVRGILKTVVYSSKMSHLMGPNLSCFTKPVYVEVDRSGPPHRHVFTVRCSVTYYTLSEPRGIGTLSREGVANSKKDARQAAADYTLQALVALSADKETRPDGVSPLYPVTTGSGPGALPQQQPAFTQQDATVGAQRAWHTCQGTHIDRYFAICMFAHSQCFAGSWQCSIAFFSRRPSISYIDLHHAMVLRCP